MQMDSRSSHPRILRGRASERGERRMGSLARSLAPLASLAHSPILRSPRSLARPLRMRGCDERESICICIYAYMYVCIYISLRVWAAIFKRYSPFFELVIFLCFRPNPYTRMRVSTIRVFLKNTKAQ